MAAADIQNLAGGGLDGSAGGGHGIPDISEIPHLRPIAVDGELRGRPRKRGETG